MALHSWKWGRKVSRSACQVYSRRDEPWEPGTVVLHGNSSWWCLDIQRPLAVTVKSAIRKLNELKDQWTYHHLGRHQSIVNWIIYITTQKKTDIYTPWSLSIAHTGQELEATSLGDPKWYIQAREWCSALSRAATALWGLYAEWNKPVTAKINTAWFHLYEVCKSCSGSRTVATRVARRKKGEIIAQGHSFSLGRWKHPQDPLFKVHTVSTAVLHTEKVSPWSILRVFTTGRGGDNHAF